MDYASDDTKKKGEEIIQKELANIPKEKVREKTKEYLQEIENGNRDFRF